jgi:NADH-quinone oxidoreductase subunit E
MDYLIMLPEPLHDRLRKKIAEADHPRELVVDVMYAVQSHYGYLSDEAVFQVAELMGMTPLEVEELATFYDFIYRDPVGSFVIHVCDGVVCWMSHQAFSIFDYLLEKLGVTAGETTSDGLFTVLPTACFGYCDHAPAVLVNGRPYGPLTPEKIDEILEKLREEGSPSVPDR